jgi:hypothetical protein
MKKIIFFASVLLAGPALGQSYPVRQPASPLIRINPNVAIIPGLPPFYGYTFGVPQAPKPAPVVVVPPPVIRPIVPPVVTPKPVVVPPAPNTDKDEAFEAAHHLPDIDIRPFTGYHH